MISEFYEPKTSNEFGAFCVTMDTLITADQPENSEAFFSIFQDKLYDINVKYHAGAIAYYDKQS